MEVAIVQIEGGRYDAQITGARVVMTLTFEDNVETRHDSFVTHPYGSSAYLAFVAISNRLKTGQSRRATSICASCDASDQYNKTSK